MSIYVYNNVRLTDCRTLIFKVEEVRDPTNTDKIRTKYTIRVQGFLAADVSSISQDSGAFLQGVKDALTTPRRACSYTSGSLVVSCGNIDANKGPTPLPVTIPNVITNGTFIVEHGFVVELVDCDDTCNPRDPIVSLRWTQSESFDGDQFSTITTRGKLIVRTDLLTSADTYRGLATPPLLADYKRERAEYTLSPDGMELDFAFTDQEYDRLPPYPATTADMKYRVDVTKGGVNRVGSVVVGLTGRKGTSRKDLLTRAISMCYSKLVAEGIFNAGTSNNYVPIITGSFEEDCLGKPAVRASMSCILPPMQTRGFNTTGAFATGFAAAAAALGITAPAAPLSIMPSAGVETAGLGSNKPGIAPPTRSRLAGLLAALFNDPCLCDGTEVELKTGGTYPQPFNTSMSTGAWRPAEVNLSTVPLPPFSEPNYDPVDPPYDWYEIETATTTDLGLVQMPATGAGNSPTATETVQVSGGISQMIVNWVASRQGAPPKLPEFTPSDPNLVGLGGSTVASQAIPNADGTALIYMMAGYYVYSIVDFAKWKMSTTTPPMVTDEIRTGVANTGGGFFSQTAASLATGNNPAAQEGSNPFVNKVNLDSPDLAINNLFIPGAFGGGLGFSDQSGTAPGVAGELSFLYQPGGVLAGGMPNFPPGPDYAPPPAGP